MQLKVPGTPVRLRTASVAAAGMAPCTPLGRHRRVAVDSGRSQPLGVLGPQCVLLLAQLVEIVHVKMPLSCPSENVGLTA